MKNWWIKLGCFLTGYNYQIMSNSSEVAIRVVKRYTSALIIVCLLWLFIGYSFANRYFHCGIIGSSISALCFVAIIIQIERQIILSNYVNNWLRNARIMIAILMAFIGSLIIDQIIFKEDIELEKTTFIQTRVDKALISKTAELRNQIINLDTIISKKENERSNFITDIAKNPTYKAYSTQSTTITKRSTKFDSLTNKEIIIEESMPTSTTLGSNFPNPKILLIPPLEETIKNLRTQKTEKETALLNIRPEVEKEIKQKIGFLDELEVMWSLIIHSWISIIVYFIFFLFLIMLEILVLISKLNEKGKENDYDKTIEHHSRLLSRKLELFAEMSEKKLKN